VVAEQLAEQFEDWNLPRDIEYKSYCQIVDKPVTPMALKKSFYNWKTALMSLPPVKATPVPASVEPEQTEIDPLEALSKGKTQNRKES